jgi:hypothetical protein
VAVDALVPGGPSWKASTGRPVWIYRDRLGTFDGITKVALKERTPGSGELKFTVQGKLGTYLKPVPPIVKATLVIDSPIAASGQCGESTYTEGTLSSCKFVGADRVLCK